MPVPVRTCIGCRSREEKVRLIRIVLRDGGVAVDVRQREPGRGAYVHPRPECLDQARSSDVAWGGLYGRKIDGQQAAVTIRQFLGVLT